MFGLLVGVLVANGVSWDSSRRFSSVMGKATRTFWSGLLIDVPAAKDLPGDSWWVFLCRNVFSLCWSLRTVDGDFFLVCLFCVSLAWLLIWRVPYCSPFLVSKNSLAWCPPLLSFWNVSRRMLMVSLFMIGNSWCWSADGDVVPWQESCFLGHL